MKTCKVLIMFMLAGTIGLVSCSGDDGEQGPQGVPGKDGTNGTNGVDGTDGTNGISCWDLNGNGTGDADEDINQDGNFDGLDCQGVDGTNGIDGNANVQQFFYDITLFGNYSNLTLDLLNIVDQPANYAFIYYLTDFDGKAYSIPGPLYNVYYTTVSTDVVSGGNSLYIDFFNSSDDTQASVPNALFTQVIVVAMELTNGAKNSESLFSDLKAAGVDTNDYHAVAKYFGLE